MKGLRVFFISIFLSAVLAFDCPAANTFKNLSLSVKIGCQSLLQIIGYRHVQALRQAHQLNSRHFLQVVATISGGENIDDFTLPQAKEAYAEWIRLYKQHKDLKAIFETAKHRLSERITAFQSATQNDGPYQFTSLPAAPSIDFGRVHIHGDGLKPNLKISTKSDLKYFIRKESYELELIKAIEVREEWLQAIRYLKLKLLEAAISDPGEDVDAKKIKEELSTLLAPTSEFKPDENIVRDVEAKLKIESNALTQLLRTSFSRTNEGFNKLIEALTALEKLGKKMLVPTASFAAIAAAGGMLVSAYHSVLPPDAEEVRREKIALSLKELSINSRTPEEFFTQHLKSLLGANYPEEAIAVALDFILKKRPSLEAQAGDPPSFTPEHYAKAKEIYGLIVWAVQGEKGPWNRPLGSLPVLQRLPLRTENDERLARIAELARRTDFRALRDLPPAPLVEAPKPQPPTLQNRKEIADPRKP